MQDMGVFIQVVAAIGLLLGCAASLARAADPVKQVNVYVLPYYASAASSSETPRVAVGKKFDALLSSNRLADVVAARDMIQREAQFITPMTLMVLAIRLYDVGLRDDSVFWFYVAKDRYATLAEVLDVRSPALAQVEQATRDFAELAGPTINGYAFCDIARQKALRAQALDWVAGHRYQALFIPDLPAKPGDRHINLQRGLESLRAQAQQEAHYLEQPDNVAQLKTARDAHGADEKYCWH